MRTHSTTFRALTALLMATGLLTLGAFGQGVSPKTFSLWSAPVNLGAIVNGADLDACPFLSKDGLHLFFVSTRSGGVGGADIWVTQRESVQDAWGAPANLGFSVNSAQADNCPYISTDGHHMIFNSDRSGTLGLADLYISYRRRVRDDFGWEPAENLTALNSASDDFGAWAFPSDLTGDATLYFVSGRPGGVGGPDIYESEWGDDETFSAPVLVPGINTTSQDSLPSVRRDGSELFVTSNRPGGVGGNDLWVATRASQADPWSALTNLGAVNSVALDLRAAISWDGTTIIFPSNRAGTLGGLDLWQITRVKASGQDKPHSGR